MCAAESTENLPHASRQATWLAPWHRARSVLGRRGARSRERQAPETRSHGAILFADVCGSTTLYSGQGDRAALALVGLLIDQLAEVVRARGGTVIRSKGDDLLCVFPDAVRALAAANAMAAARGAGGVRMRVGVHVGDYIRARGDVFGDCVNLTASLLALAKPGEVVLTADAVVTVPEDRRAGLRRLGSQFLKGRVAPVTLYSSLPGPDPHGSTVRQAAPVTECHAAGPITVAALAERRVSVRLGGAERQLGEGDRVTLGRAPHCDLQIPEPFVSRDHAELRVRGGKLMLTDRSSTGTWVHTTDGYAFAVRRETVVLTRSGTIAAGADHAALGDLVVHFTV
ncbi:MAG: adenylate/guanylate cyclase domain-containing protein [Ectothiorhodospiraceae bacterium]|nr:adenylate/guanylate cyclase domain-containing protein [Chromatiales bacterium]MCP5157055.1 adenylate/guanylate cyclase domain-containing protein [Ectothiorhodospiraceae bacterium]